MSVQLQALWLVSAIAFFFAALASMRNYFLTKKASGLWLWLSIAMAFIAASRLSNFLVSINPLWQEAATSLLLTGAVITTLAVYDFDKEVDVCVNCNSSLAELPGEERKSKARKMLKGF